MRELAAEAIEVGALGFASSRLTIHKTESGPPIPSYDAAERRDRGDRPRCRRRRRRADPVRARHSGRRLRAACCRRCSTWPRTSGCRSRSPWSSATPATRPGRTPSAWSRRPMRHGGDVTAQMFPRPIGLMIGLRADRQPVRALSRATRRSRTCRWPSASPRCANPRCAPASWPTSRPATGTRCCIVAQMWDWIFPLGDHAELRARPPSTASAPGPGPAGSTRWRRPTTGCSTTTGTPCCSVATGQLPRTTRWTPSAS